MKEPNALIVKVSVIPFVTSVKERHLFRTSVLSSQIRERSGNINT
jgi:hypothetical protein